jgi:hypothetical protein
MFGRVATVSVGDRFIRRGQPSRVFAVEIMFEPAGQPIHARLFLVGSTGEKFTVSVSALEDPNIFQRIET